MNRKSKEFLALQDKWDKKLKKSGFVDIEENRTENAFLTSWSYSRLSSIDPDIIKTKITYYTAAEHFLNTHTFKNKTHKHMWQMHSEGHGVRVIATKFKCSKSTVQNIIKPLVMEMKKTWTTPLALVS